LDLLEGQFDARESDQICRILIEDIVEPNLNVMDESAIEAKLKEAVKELISGKPLAYITGVSYFYGRPFNVDQHVLIPRPETEELVYAVLNSVKGKQAKVLEIGSGSGCIPVTLKLERPDWIIESIDISSEALKVAKTNASAFGAEVQFKQVDFLDEQWWDSAESYGLIVSNPPYVHWDEAALMSKNTLEHEPEIALFAPGEDALIFYRKLAAFGALKLEKGGMMLLELNEFLSMEIDQIFKDVGVYTTEIMDDLQGKPRILRVWKN
jgi:release factor glutamine methyltransferase